MNGDPKPQTPESGWQYKPVDNPPSLSEPSSRTATISPLPPAPAKTVADNQQPAAETSDAATPTAPAEVVDPYAGGLEDVSADHDMLEADHQPEDAVEWTSSSEELQSQTSAWRLRMTLISLVASAIIYAISRDVVSAGSVAVVGLVFAFLGSRKPPHALDYKLDHTGITIGQKHYSYNEFRAFSVADDARSPTISVVPLKRFLPLLALHYDPQQRDKIVEMLADYLPLEAQRRDAFDSIINRVKF